MSDGDDESDRTGGTTGEQLAVLVDEYEAFTGQKIDRNDYAELKRAIDTDVVPIAEADRSFFVLGSYDDGRENRLQLVRNQLDAVGKPFLLKDLRSFDDLLRWTTQFKVMANRATHVVGLYEDSRGGHEWEAGWLDHQPYRGKFTVIKRDYPDVESKAEPFDGMFAHFLETIAALGQMYRFEASTDAPEKAVNRGVKARLNDFKADILDAGIDDRRSTEGKE